METSRHLPTRGSESDLETFLRGMETALMQIIWDTQIALKPSLEGWKLQSRDNLPQPALGP